MTRANADAPAPRDPARRFEGKRIIVTGAAQGIGRQVALRAAEQGAAVALVDRAALVKETAKEVATSGATAAPFIANLESYADNVDVMKKVAKKLGGIDILINNVGGAIWMKPFHEFAEEEIEAEVRRSLFPTLWGCRAVLPHMLAQGHGAIVNVSSIATRGINRLPYSAAKGGVNALTASLAFELAEKNIRVNAIAPGGTKAPPRRIPRNDAPLTQQEAAWMQAVVDQTVSSSLMRRYGTLDEQAAAILFLASEEASYITGTILPVGGGDLG